MQPEELATEVKERGGRLKKAHDKRWELQIPVAKNCDWAAKPPTVFVDEDAYRKMMSMMERMDDREWLAYLVGIEDTFSITVNDLYIPEQEASGGHAESFEIPPEGCIGIVHSHHSMGAFFSGTDEKSANSNNRLSIVLSHEGMKANIRTMLPCGMQKHETEAPVRLVWRTNMKWAETMAKKVHEPKVVYSGFALSPMYAPKKPEKAEIVGKQSQLEIWRAYKARERALDREEEERLALMGYLG